MAKKIKLKQESQINLIPDDFFPKTSEEFFDLLNRVVNGDKMASKQLKTILDFIQQDDELREAIKQGLSSKELRDDDSWEDDFWDDDSMDSDYFQFEEPLMQREDVKEFHIRIKLNHIDRKIWREVKVPSNMTLEALAYLLVDVMGWNCEHDFCFRHKNLTYCSANEIARSLFVDDLDFSRYTVSDLLRAKGDKMKLDYDYGDGWEHDVWVKGIREYEKDEPHHIAFVKGFGACPPEDCGGVWGYGELLDLMEKKRKTKEEKERLAYYEMSSDFYFDPDDCEEEYIKDIVSDWNNRLNLT